MTAAIALALLLFALFGSGGFLIALGVLGGPIIFVGVAAWLWQRPIRGVYVLFAAAVALDIDYTATTQNGYYIGHYLPFWQNITSWSNIHIIVSPAELFMVLLLSVWFLKAAVQPHFHFDKGTVLLPVSLYVVMVFVGLLHGVGSGGNTTTALWEVRSQIYMFAAYILACNLIRTRSHITTIMWILVLATGFRAIEGTIRYFIYFRGQILQEYNVFPHEQAFFLNAYLTLAPILFLYGASKALKRVTLFLLPWVLFIDLAVNRRAAVAALVVGMLLLLLVTFVVNPRSRRIVGAILVVLAVGFPPYYLAFQHKPGTIAEPARAIASNFNPDTRDAASNQYRLSEDYDIMATVKSSSTSIVIGYGFGKAMLMPQVLPDISHLYVWWNILPHNSILWVWMRLGTVGYILLWIMLGTAIMQAMSLARRLGDPQLQGVALFIALMLVQQVIVGYLDLQWVSYRNLVTVGLFFGLIGCLGRLGTTEGILDSDDSVVTRGSRERGGIGMRAHPVAREQPARRGA